MYICNCCSSQIIILEKGYPMDLDKNPIRTIPISLEKPIYFCPCCGENSDDVDDIAHWIVKNKKDKV